MATLVPLPHVDELPKVVIFHREHPSEPMLIMQVPTSDTEEFETFRLRLDNADHKQWLAKLPGARDLSYKLTFEQHLAYFPHDDGTTMRLENPDEPSYLQKVIAQMRTMPSKAKTDAEFLRRRQRKPGVSRLRQALSRKGAFGGRL
jgi:hypothetical protein